MVYPLMPKATALWLVDKTTLTFEQIADFCGLHITDIQLLADEKISLVPFDPVSNLQLSEAEIARCAQDPVAKLQLLVLENVLEKKSKRGKYISVSLRKDRPDGIAWMLKHQPEVNDRDLAQLLGTTKTTVEAIRKKTHRNSLTIKPQHPVTLGLCSQKDFDQLVNKSTLL